MALVEHVEEFFGLHELPGIEEPLLDVAVDPGTNLGGFRGIRRSGIFTIDGNGPGVTWMTVTGTAGALGVSCVLAD